MKKIHAFVWAVTAISTMLWAGHVMGAEQQSGLAAGEQPAATVEAQVEAPAISHDAGKDGIADNSIAAWLISEFNQQASIVAWAQERVHNDQLRDFANQTAGVHREFVARLQEEGLVAREQADPDLGFILKQLAQRMESHGGPGGRIVLGFRGEPGAPGYVEQIPERRQQRQELREQVREERRDVAKTRRDDDAEEPPTEEREALREARDDLREQRREAAREMVRTALPIIRENLPWILENVGQAIEDSKVEAQDQR
jgi:hypothetical protein